MNRCKSVRAELEAISKSQLVEEVQIVEASESVLKARVQMAKGLFVQVYRNDRFGTTDFALVLGRQRIYGRDEIAGKWHRHSHETPEMHDHSPEGVRPVRLVEFWEEVQELLCRLGWTL
ncbi:MAG: hypothetical protein AB1512_11120 [Thermodesulfobacteriota bacterium]